MSAAAVIARIKQFWADRSRRRIALAVLALVVLPLMAWAAPIAWAALAGFPGARFTDEQLKALSWLPMVSMYAFAAVVVAVGFNNLFCYEPGRSTEAGWHDLALAGNAHAKWLLVRNDIRWAVLLGMSGAFFWMAR